MGRDDLVEDAGLHRCKSHTRNGYPCFGKPVSGLVCRTHRAETSRSTGRCSVLPLPDPIARGTDVLGTLKCATATRCRPTHTAAPMHGYNKERQAL